MSRRRRRERGASILELAFVAPVMVMLTFGVVDLARGYALYIEAENAAREGAAFAQIHPHAVDCDPGVDIGDRASAEERSVSSRPDYNLAVHWRSAAGVWTQAVGDECTMNPEVLPVRARVDVTVTLDVLTPLVENMVGGDIDLTGSAEVRVQR